MDEEYRKVVTKMDRPIPGSSLTVPVEEATWRKPPEYTSVHKASEFIFEKVTEEETYVSLMNAIDDGSAIMDVVQVLAFQGFNQNKWNPDLMMLIIEPTAYILMALAERAGIDYTIYRGEEEDEPSVMGVQLAKEKFDRMKNAKETSQIPDNVIPQDIQEKIEEMPEPKSLLARD